MVNHILRKTLPYTSCQRIICLSPCGGEGSHALTLPNLRRPILNRPTPKMTTTMGVTWSLSAKRSLLEDKGRESLQSGPWSAKRGERTRSEPEVVRPTDTVSPVGGVRDQEDTHHSTTTTSHDPSPTSTPERPQHRVRVRIRPDHMDPDPYVENRRDGVGVQLVRSGTRTQRVGRRSPSSDELQSDPKTRVFLEDGKVPGP